jgi:transcriptional regulator with XRE-family HTH domain
MRLLCFYAHSVIISAMELAEAFGQVLKSIRQENRMTQVRLATITGLDVGSISRFERGILLPSFFTLFIIAKTLKTSPSEILKSVELLRPAVLMPKVFSYLESEQEDLKTSKPDARRFKTTKTKR